MGTRVEHQWRHTRHFPRGRNQRRCQRAVQRGAKRERPVDDHVPLDGQAGAEPAVDWYLGAPAARGHWGVARGIIRWQFAGPCQVGHHRDQRRLLDQQRDGRWPVRPVPRAASGFAGGRAVGAGRRQHPLCCQRQLAAGAVRQSRNGRPDRRLAVGVESASGEHHDRPLLRPWPVQLPAGGDGPRF